MTVGGPPDKDSSNGDLSKSDGKEKRRASLTLTNETRAIVKQCKQWTKKPGIHSVNHMSTAGLKYTGNGDTARCEDCRLEVSNWTIDMKPFTIHSNQNPSCPFVLNMKSSALARRTRQTELQSAVNTSFESDLLQQMRRRTFSHWPHRTIPSSTQMIEAGFFNCNVGDRVICLYCNLICQQWTPHTDDPCEVHRTLSPACKYVKAKLIRPSTSSIIIVKESSTAATSSNQSPTSVNLDPLRSNEIVFTAACNHAYAEVPNRLASFATWPHENLPPVNDLVRAGFFYTGTKTIVTCFYCNGSLQNWGRNDNPIVEHARWFPRCAYAKQLCGDELYRKIQEAKRAQQERARANEAKEKTNSGVTLNTNVTTNSGQLLISDESTLARLVAARLDLPISHSLLDRGFKLSIIKRCWEDQLRLKQVDFLSEYDLYVACVILQKQIEHIDGKKENITIPSIKMKQIREQNEARMREPAPTTTRSISNSTDVEMTASSQSLTNESTSSQSSVESASKPMTGNQGETKIIKPTTSTASDQDQSTNATPSNPCVLCLTEEKRLACIPCGHLATCVPCGHALRSCPICRREIEAFVRIYI